MGKERVILHFDMNSYFASVEQQADPRLRGRPVGIASTLVAGGCLIATSKEAKSEGIVTGLRIRDALKIDPSLRVVEVDPPKYRSTTERIFSIVRQYSEDIEPYSIDEAFVDFTGQGLSLRAAAAIAETIKRRIRDEVGDWLTCSAGIAWTRWLAKFVSDTAPKGGLVVLAPERLEAYLAGRPVTEAWGIARALERRLNLLGIRTLDELKHYSAVNLIEAFGVKGYELWANVNGVELAGVQPLPVPKSVGHSHVLRQRTRAAAFHRGVLAKLCEKTGRRLRQLGLEAHGLWAGASWVDGEHDRMSRGRGWGGFRRFSSGLTSSRGLYRLAWSILEPQISGRVAVWLGVTACQLNPRSKQASFWATRDETALEQALDNLNNRYGEYTIQWGAMANMRRQAPERIGYRKTVDMPDPLADVMLVGE